MSKDELTPYLESLLRHLFNMGAGCTMKPHHIYYADFSRLKDLGYVDSCHGDRGESFFITQEGTAVVKAIKHGIERG